MSLFSIPIATGGSFECTSPAEKVYLLTFTSPPDNRLTTAFLEAFALALDIIEERFPRGVVVTTSGIAKFYSNGLDLQHAVETRGFWDDALHPLWRRLLTYPMPTVALINGHAYAGGLFTALHHDYRIQNPSKGYLCLNEVHFGAVIPTPMVTIVKTKVGNRAAVRDLLTEGRRFNAQEALAHGIIDATGGLEETLALIKSRNLTKLGESGVYGAIKEDTYREQLAALDSPKENLQWRKRVEDTKAQLAQKRARRVEEWSAAQGRSKI
ncbi:hypothetical protein VTO42DRAFT_7552 [Malbranchea cinnamomea]